MAIPPTTTLGQPGTVFVHAPHAVLHDIKHVTRLLQDVLGKLGCMACCSGFDIRFLHQSDFVASLDDKGGLLTQAITPVITR